MSDGSSEPVRSTADGLVHLPDDGHAKLEIPLGAGSLVVEGVVGKDGKPIVLVTISQEGKTLQCPLELAQAQQYAATIYEACEGAITDAFMIQFAREKLEQEEEAAGLIVYLLREFRQGFPPRRKWFNA